MPRPWVVTLPYTLNNLTAINYLQGIAGSIAWLLVLLAVLNLHFRRNAIHWLVLSSFVIILLSGQVVAWDQVAQSDSFALTGAALVLAGIIRQLGPTKRPLSSYLLVASGTLICGLIRFPIVVLSLVFVLYCFSRESRSRIKLSLRLFGTSLIVLLCAYVLYGNHKMDLAWGREFAQRDDVAGRSYQQLAVINGLPQGKERVRRAVEVAIGGESCLAGLLEAPMPGNDAMAWWINATQACPDDAARASTDFTGNYLKELLKDPMSTLYYLWPSIDEAYRIGRVPPPASMFPTPILSLFYGDAAIGQILPVTSLLLFVALCFYGRRRREEVPVNHQEVLILLATVSSLLGLLVTVALSPSDTARVGGVFVISSVLLSWLLIGLRVDRLMGTPKEHELPYE